MLRIQIIGLALVSALVISAVAAGSASATVLPHEWLLNGKLIAAPIKVHSHGLLLLTDDTAPGGATQVHCFGFNSELVGPHALDLVDSITAEQLGTNKKITCSFDKAGACQAGTAPTAEAVNLPWHTELTLIGGVLRDMIMSDGAGEPGWAVTCKTIIGNITDTCVAPLGHTGVDNVASGVLLLFDKTSNATNPANCKVGAEAVRLKAGLVEGDITLLSPPGSLLLAL